MGLAIQAQQTTIQNLKRQVGQWTKAMSNREKEKLPNTSQVNRRESVIAISLRSWKVLEEPNVGEKSQIEKGVNVEIEGEKVQAKEPPSNQNDEVKPYVPPILFP